MKHRHGSQELHERLQNNLVTRLKKTYPFILENVVYKLELDGRLKEGELDVLASKDGVNWHYYEVKSCHRFAKARNQYERAVEVKDYLPIPFEVRTLKGVYFCIDGVKRIR
jgi:hypothetical protein